MPEQNSNLIKVWIATIIVACMCIVVAISYIFFQNQSLRLDEAQSVWQSSHSPGMILNLIGQDVHVPLYPLMLHVWLLFFGSDIRFVRLFSLVFFLVSIPLFYIVGRRIYSRNVSIFATVLFSISPFMNWYANEARMYSLFVFIVLLNMYFFISIIKKDTAISWGGFAVSALFGIYTHYFFLLFLLINLVFYFSNRHLFGSHAGRKIVSISFLLLVAFAPWVLYVIFLGKVSNSTPSLLPPTSVDLFNVFSQFLIGFQTDYINTIFLSLWPLLTLLAFLSLRRGKIDSSTTYLVLIFVLPITLAFFVSLYVHPIFLSRYLIFTLPALYLFISWFLNRYPRMLMNFFACVAACLLILGLFIEGLSDKTPTKENYKAATTYLESHALPTDVIVVSAPFTIYPVSYYYHGPNTITTLPIWDQNKIGPIPAFSPEKLPGEVDSIRGSHSNIWILLSYDQGYSENIRMYFDTHFERLHVEIFSPGLILYEYKLRYI